MPKSSKLIPSPNLITLPLSITKLISHSIVAVHGLNPRNAVEHAESTWTASNGSMWLKDFLPQKLKTARVLLFGYNSNVAFETSTSGISDHAVNLLNRLKLTRQVRIATEFLYYL